MGIVGRRRLGIMTRMEVAFIDDFEGGRGKGGFEGGAYSVGSRVMIGFRAKPPERPQLSGLSILAVRHADTHNERMKLDSKYFNSIRTRRKGPRVEEPPAKPTCQWDGCDKPGIHRAPVGRNAENQYFVFCFEHVKEYNKGYNYFLRPQRQRSGALPRRKP